MNKLLANTCRKEMVGDIEVFELELHCAIARVTAVLKSSINELQYDILNVEIV